MHGKIAFCFDLDSTITMGEILPQLAQPLGVADDMKMLTELTMKGFIPFSQSFNLRIKLLAQLPLEESVKIVSNISLNDYIVSFIKKHKDDCYIITGNLDCYISNLITGRIGCDFFCSKGDLRDGKLYGVEHIVDKADIVTKIKEEYDAVITIGDGSNDIGMTQISDIGIAYSGVRQSPQALIDVADIVIYSADELVDTLEHIREIYVSTGKLPCLSKKNKTA